MKRSILAAALLLPIPFAALPLLSVAVAFGDQHGSSELVAEVAPGSGGAHAQLAFIPASQPSDPLCDSGSVGF